MAKALLEEEQMPITRTAWVKPRLLAPDKERIGTQSRSWRSIRSRRLRAICGWRTRNGQGPMILGVSPKGIHAHQSWYQAISGMRSEKFPSGS